MFHTKLLSITLVVIFFSSCMTYSNIPLVDSNNIIQNITKKKTLNYQIEGSALFAGPTAIRNVITSESSYASTSPAEKEITSGDFLRVLISQSPPSVPAVGFGYLSLATLTILPFWSTNDGSILTFTLYRNGKSITSKEYVISRKTFVWIVMLPFAWVNFMTPSEEEAFAACARDFMKNVSKIS